jgi:hypothetical protein
MSNRIKSATSHALALDPTNPQPLYAGTDGGIFKSTNGGGRISKSTNGSVSWSAYPGWAEIPGAGSRKSASSRASRRR